MEVMVVGRSDSWGTGSSLAISWGRGEVHRGRRGRESWG